MTTAPVDARPHALCAPGRATTAMVLFATAIGLLAGALTTLDQPTHAVVWGALALTAYAAAFLCLVRAGQDTGLGLARWRFGSWILFWYGAAFGLATVSWSQPQSGTPAQIAVSSVLRALWLVAVGLTAWALGYFVGPGRPMERSAVRGMTALGRRFVGEVRSPAAPWILYAIGVVARVISTATTGRFGYVGDASAVVSTATGYGEILNLLSLCAPLAVAAAALQVYRERLAGARITLAVLFLAELAFGAAAGGKENFVIAVLAVAIPFSATRRRLPRASLVALILIFLFVVIPFNLAYRNAARGGSVTLPVSQALAAAPEILQQTVTGYNPVTVIPGSLDYLLQRVREIDSPGIILQRTPGQIGFLSPVQLVEEPAIGLVPRAVWPDKPILIPGYQVSQEYYGLPPTVINSSAITPVGDLYRHGGWIPVIAGMFLFGCGVRLLDNVLDVRVSPHAIFLVLLLFPTLVKNETDWLGLLVGIPATVLIWLLAVSLTFRPRRPV